LCICLVMGLPVEQLLAAETDTLVTSGGPVPVTTAPLGQVPGSRGNRAAEQAPPQPVVMSFDAFKALLAEEEEAASATVQIAETPEVTEAETTEVEEVEEVEEIAEAEETAEAEIIHTTAEPES